MFLPVEKAVEKIREHVVILKTQVGRPLHEIPIPELRIAVVNTFRSHGDFQMLSGAKGAMYLVPKVKNQNLYSYYELGHHILIERLASKLKHEGKLSEEHEQDFKTLFGRLYYNPPASIANEQINAVDDLEQKLGTRKADAFLRLVFREWIKQAKEVAKYPPRKWDDRQDPGEETEDMFHNPTTNPAMDGLVFIRKGEKPTAAVKRILAEYANSLASNRSLYM